MQLHDLLSALRAVNVRGSTAIEVRGVSCDSRDVEEGMLYVACT